MTDLMLTWLVVGLLVLKVCFWLYIGALVIAAIFFDNGA
jgi:hypothetical protein